MFCCVICVISLIFSYVGFYNSVFLVRLLVCTARATFHCSLPNIIGCCQTDLTYISISDKLNHCRLFRNIILNLWNWVSYQVIQGQKAKIDINYQKSVFVVVDIQNIPAWQDIWLRKLKECMFQDWICQSKNIEMSSVSCIGKSSNVDDYWRCKSFLILSSLSNSLTSDSYCGLLWLHIGHRNPADLAKGSHDSS